MKVPTSVSAYFTLGVTVQGRLLLERHRTLKLRLQGDVLVYVTTTYQLHVFNNIKSIILINEFQSRGWQSSVYVLRILCLEGLK